MAKNKFEKRRKGVETIFDIMFWLYLIEVLGYVIFKILHITGIASVDIFDLTEFIILAIATCFMFFAARLAHKGHIAAGIIGIIVALCQIIIGNIIGLIIGILLIIDSILYLINYNRK